MAKLAFVLSLAVAVLLAFGGRRALELMAESRTSEGIERVKPPVPVFDGDNAGEGKGQSKGGGDKLKNGLIGEKVEKFLQNDSSASPPTAKRPKIQEASRILPISATEKEVLIKENVKNVREEMEKDLIKTRTGVENLSKETLAPRKDASDEETEKKVVSKTVTLKKPKREHETDERSVPLTSNETVLIEKKNETHPNGTEIHVTEKVVKLQQGRDPQKENETVFSKKDEINLEPKKNQVVVESKGEGESSELKDNVVKKTVVQKQNENGTERETSEKSKVRSIIAVKKPEDKKRAVGNDTLVKDEAAINETKVPVQKKLPVSRKPAREVVENVTETTTNTSSELSDRAASTVEKTQTKVVSEKVSTNETKRPVKEETEVSREPAKKVEVEKKTKTITEKEVKEEAQKPALKIRPEEKAPPTPCVVPLATECSTDGTDQSGYGHESELPSRRCLRPCHHRCSSACKLVVVCSTTDCTR